MRPSALTAIVLTYISGLLGIVATLRALIRAWYAVGFGFDTDPLRFCHSILNLIALGVVTVALFGGVVLLGHGDRRGRGLVIAGSVAVIVLSLIELAVWAKPGFPVWSSPGTLGVHRWVWFALSIVTLVVVLVAGSQSRGATTDPEVPSPRSGRSYTALIAALAFAMAFYHLWRAKEQFDNSLLYITDLTDLLPTTPNATWTLAMLEPVIVSATAAATLIIGGLLTAVGVAAGRYVVIAGCTITVAQGIFGWFDLDRLFYEIGAADLATVFASRSASVVVLTLTVPVVTAVLAATARPRTPRT